MPTLKHTIEKFNLWLALVGTEAFGSMWAFYVFFAWGLLGLMPFLPKQFTEIVLLVSSAWIQLWALPLIAVGSSVRAKAAEKRAKEDHMNLKAELAEMRDLQKDNDQIMVRLSKIEFLLHALVESRKHEMSTKSDGNLE